MIVAAGSTPRALVLDELPADVAGQVADVHRGPPAAVQLESEVVGKTAGAEEILLVLAPGVNQLAVEPAAASLLVVVAEDGAAEADSFVVSVHFLDVFELTALAADALVTEEVDAHVGVEHLVSVPGVQLWREESVLAEETLLNFRGVDVLAEGALAAHVLEIVAEHLFYDALAIVRVVHRLDVGEGTLPSLRTGPL